LEVEEAEIRVDTTIYRAEPQEMINPRTRDAGQ
jgi:hypothetical protein